MELGEWKVTNIVLCRKPFLEDEDVLDGFDSALFNADDNLLFLGLNGGGMT